MPNVMVSEDLQQIVEYKKQVCFSMTCFYYEYFCLLCIKNKRHFLFLGRERLVGYRTGFGLRKAL